MRFLRDEIYTAVGDILIACNPFKALPIYARETLMKYDDHAARQPPPNRRLVASRRGAFAPFVDRAPTLARGWRRRGRDGRSDRGRAWGALRAWGCPPRRAHTHDTHAHTHTPRPTSPDPTAPPPPAPAGTRRARWAARRHTSSTSRTAC